MHIYLASDDLKELAFMVISLCY